MAHQLDQKKSGQLAVREATDADLSAIREIYNHYVKNSTASFDTLEQSEQQRKEWYDQHRAEELPVLVAAENGRVVGWASLSFYHTRCAYRQTLEPSIYVAPTHTRRGLGQRLMQALIDLATKRGDHSLVGLVCSENQASIEMVRSSGFETVGRLREVGRKCERWLDVIIVQRML